MRITVAAADHEAAADSSLVGKLYQVELDLLTLEGDTVSVLMESRKSLSDLRLIDDKIDDLKRQRPKGWQDDLAKLGQLRDMQVKESELLARKRSLLAKQQELLARKQELLQRQKTLLREWEHNILPCE